MNEACIPPIPELTLAELDERTAFDYLEYHARRTPQRIAVTGRMGDVSWTRFHSDAQRFACALGELGVRPGQVVAISCPNLYLHWLLVIACECIGSLSASFSLTETAEDVATLLGLADFVLAEQPLAGERRVHLTQDWVAGVRALPDSAAHRHPRHPTGPDAPIRIVRSSGSTGTPKAMILRRRMHNFWISTIAETNFGSGDVRFYAGYPFTTNCCRSRVETCLRLGGTVILGSAGQDIIAFGATHCWVLPRDMVMLLQNIQGEWPSRDPLRLILGGAAVSASLHDDIVAKIGADVLVLYATNETGFIGTVDRDGVCSAVRNADVRIVDENGNTPSAGEAGNILVRTPGIVDGYLNDPATTQRLFREGWFLTGDIGVWRAPGKFEIVGRRDDVLNVGGIKMTPNAIEDLILRGVSGLRDVAVTSVTNGSGVEELCVAVVPVAADEPRDLTALVRECLGSLGRFHLLPMRDLPLTESGKVRRSALKEMFAAMSPTSPHG